MRKMRGRWIAFVVILIAGCAKRQPWPATVVAANGFTSGQQQQVMAAIQDLNAHANYTVIDTSGSGSVTYPITFTYGTPTGEPDSPNLAGQALVADDNCSISLSDKLFQSEDGADLESVVWHELGHCAGLGHVTDPGAIMYPTTNAFSNYQSQELASFLQSAMGSAGLNANGNLMAPPGN